MARIHKFVDSPEYIEFVRRVLRSLRQRGKYFDTEDLPQLAALSREISRIILECVRACRDNGSTWEEIGAAVGVSKQAAQQRWGDNDGS